jgi:hypothetical protein
MQEVDRREEVTPNHKKHILNSKSEEHRFSVTLEITLFASESSRRGTLKTPSD